MKDKCILVTGSSSGIGNAITTKLLHLGAKVVGIARDHKKFIIQNDNYITYQLVVDFWYNFLVPLCQQNQTAFSEIKKPLRLH